MKRPWGRQSLPTPFPAVWRARTTQHRAWKSVNVCDISGHSAERQDLICVFRQCSGCRANAGAGMWVAEGSRVGCVVQSLQKEAIVLEPLASFSRLTES